MSWFDGTFPVNKNEFKIFFPKKVANNLYKDEYGKRALLIFDLNLLKEDSRYSTVQRFDKDGNNLLFYFPIFGKDASKAAKLLKNVCLKFQNTPVDEQMQQLVNRLKDINVYDDVCVEHEYHSPFLDRNTFSEDNFLFLLVGKSGDDYRMFGSYVYVDALSDNFKSLIKPDNTFTPIPLKRRMFCCPVCGAETLELRGYFEICRECGWEDDGTDDIDSETLPNGSWTIKTQRINYYKNKIKNPKYKWWHGPKKPSDEGEYLLDTSIEDLFKKS